MKRIKMRQKPVSPWRKTVYVEIDVGDGDSVSDVFKKTKLLQDPTFCVDHFCGEPSVTISASRQETDEEFYLRIKEHRSELAEYHVWLLENKEAIEEDERYQAEREASMSKQKLLLRKKNLLKKERALKKELKKVKEEIGEDV